MISPLFQKLQETTLSPEALKLLVKSSSIMELADVDIEMFRKILVENDTHIGKARNIIIREMNLDLDDARVSCYFFLLHYRVSTSVAWVEMSITRSLIADIYLSTLTINQF